MMLIDLDSTIVSQLSSFKNAFTDPKLYMLIFMNMCVDRPIDALFGCGPRLTTASLLSDDRAFCRMSQVQGSIANFFPIVVQGLGYGRILTLVLVSLSSRLPAR